MDFYNLRKIWNPVWFQGIRKRKNYFEGWYFKLVNPDAQIAYAIIPGISIGTDYSEAYPFIQVINGKTGESGFIKYRMDEFQFSHDPFKVSIGKNHFSREGMKVDLKGEGVDITGSISFLDPVPYPVKLLSPGVMGWYRFIPTMECYHGIVSMLHSLKGSLEISGMKTDFTGGKGYIEKDWGKSMPLAWIWIQSNHFKREDLSLSFSVANIPWKKSAFTGFLVILSTRENMYRFTTYTGTKITQLSVEDGQVSIELLNRKYRLTVNAGSEQSGKLKAPVHGEMSRTIYESIGAKVNITLSDKKGSVILEDKGDPAGMEIAGDFEILRKDLKQS